MSYNGDCPSILKALVIKTCSSLAAQANDLQMLVKIIDKDGIREMEFDCSKQVLSA